MGKKTKRKRRDEWYNTWCGALDTKYLLNPRLMYLKTSYKVESLFGHAGDEGDSLEGGSVSLGTGFKSS